jgi:uncharacterized DUF497 family protein
MATSFEWDSEKDAENQRKHGVSFNLAQQAFLDPKRVIARDLAHSESEPRYSVSVMSTRAFLQCDSLFGTK